MKDENYYKEYNYGYKIGRYQASYESSILLFDGIFNGDYKDFKKKIKWLSLYEIRELVHLLIDTLPSRNLSKQEFVENRRKILELLR